MGGQKEPGIKRTVGRPIVDKVRGDRQTASKGFGIGAVIVRTSKNGLVKEACCKICEATAAYLYIFFSISQSCPVS